MKTTPASIFQTTQDWSYCTLHCDNGPSRYLQSVYHSVHKFVEPSNAVLLHRFFWFDTKNNSNTPYISVCSIFPYLSHETCKYSYVKRNKHLPKKTTLIYFVSMLVFRVYQWCISPFHTNPYPVPLSFQSRQETVCSKVSSTGSDQYLVSEVPRKGRCWEKATRERRIKHGGLAV